MKSIMLAGAAMLGFATGAIGIAQAQQTPGSTMQQPPTGMPDPSGTPPAPTTPGTPAPPSPAADPNAGQPTGAVPPDTGMQPAPADAPRDASAPVGTSANPVTVGGNMTPPPTEAKDYPVCSRTVQDSCINPSEARKARKRR